MICPFCKNRIQYYDRYEIVDGKQVHSKCVDWAEKALEGEE